jgi:hypothetical protein
MRMLLCFTDGFLLRGYAGKFCKCRGLDHQWSSHFPYYMNYGIKVVRIFKSRFCSRAGKRKG